jgi:hypothetical protein
MLNFYPNNYADISVTFEEALRGMKVIGVGFITYMML